LEKRIMAKGKNAFYRALVVAGLLAGGAALSSPSFAAGVKHTTGTVDGFDCDIWTWIDSNDKPRTVALKRERHGNSGHGGYAIQMTYYRFYNTVLHPVGAWRKVVVNAETNKTIDPNNDGGFGYFVSHERDRYFGNDAQGNPILQTIADYVFHKDDSPLGRDFAASTAIPLDTSTAGAESFTIQYGHYGTIAPGGIDLNTGYDSPPLTKDATKFAFYTIPVTTTWVFQEGRDYPRLDISLDLSEIVPPTSTTPMADLVSFDVRGPYGVMVFDNGADRAIQSAIWGDQQYLFAVLHPMPVTRSSTWDWSSLNGGARYNGLTAGVGVGGSFEMGLFEPAPAAASALADGYAPERGFTSTSYAAAVAAHTESPSVDSCLGNQVQTLPSDGTWPYQSVQYSLPCPAQTSSYLTTPAYTKKLAWGSSSYYGTSLTAVFNGVQSYPINAWPMNHQLDYSVCLVLDWDSSVRVSPPPKYNTYLAAMAAAYTETTPVPASPDCATAAP
jgi:hypothetical protein